jgi:hypothetical protein
VVRVLTAISKTGLRDVELLERLGRAGGQKTYPPALLGSVLGSRLKGLLRLLGAALVAIDPASYVGDDMEAGRDRFNVCDYTLQWTDRVQVDIMCP